VPCRLHGGNLNGTSVAVFSVGRLLAALVAGWASKRTSNAFVFDVALLMNVAGGLLYFFASEFGELGLYAFMIGRVLLGCGSGA
jgi:MFS family permease